MRKTSLKIKIYDRLKEFGGWVHKGQIETRVKEWGYLADNGNRRCRELCESGLIEKKEENGVTLYRYKPQERKVITPLFLENNEVRMVQRTIYD